VRERLKLVYHDLLQMGSGLQVKINFDRELISQKKGIYISHSGLEPEILK
jgi:hypothetical protein